MPFHAFRPASPFRLTPLPRLARLRAVARTAIVLVGVGSALAQPARAQQPAPPASQPQLRIPDSLHSQVIELRDGSTLVGRITELTPDSVRFATSVASMVMPRNAVVSVREIRNPTVAADGQVWLPDPGITRLLFAPTGRMLEAGDGYFSNAYLFFLGFFKAPTDRVTIGGGMSILPSSDFVENNAYYVMPKVGLVKSEKVNVAAGALVGAIPAGDGVAGGIAYGVATLGPPQGNMTLGAGFGFADGEMSDRPLLMLGFYNRLSRRTAFVSENYMLPGEDGLVYSYGLRFFGERLSVDFAMWNVSNSGFMPGVPYIAFARHF